MKKYECKNKHDKYLVLPLFTIQLNEKKNGKKKKNQKPCQLCCKNFAKNLTDSIHDEGVVFNNFH